MPLVPVATVLESRDNPEAVVRVPRVGAALPVRTRALSPLLLLPPLVVKATRLLPLLRRAAGPCVSAAEELELSVACCRAKAPPTVALFRNRRLVGFEGELAGVLLVIERRASMAPPVEVRLGVVPESPSPSSSLSVEDETGPREGRGLGAVSPVDDSSPLSPSPPPSPPPSPLQPKLLSSLSSLVALLLGEPGHPGPHLVHGTRGGLTYPENSA